MPQLVDLKAYLDGLVEKFEQPAFIEDDPISIPHGFDDPRDQEVVGLYAALLAWGQRKTVLNKMAELCTLMQLSPWRYVSQFATHNSPNDLASFKHRTFQPEDAWWLTHNLSLMLKKYGSLENAFAVHLSPASSTVEKAIQGFSDEVFSIDPNTPARIRKHLARPQCWQCMQAPLHVLAMDGKNRSC